MNQTTPSPRNIPSPQTILSPWTSLGHKWLNLLVQGMLANVVVSGSLNSPGRRGVGSSHGISVTTWSFSVCCRRKRHPTRMRLSGQSFVLAGPVLDLLTTSAISGRVLDALSRLTSVNHLKVLLIFINSSVVNQISISQKISTISWSIVLLVWKRR